MFPNVQGLDLFEDECGEGGAYSYDNLYLAGWCLSKQLEVIDLYVLEQSCVCFFGG